SGLPFPSFSARSGYACLSDFFPAFPVEEQVSIIPRNQGITRAFVYKRLSAEVCYPLEVVAPLDLGSNVVAGLVLREVGPQRNIGTSLPEAHLKPIRACAGHDAGSQSGQKKGLRPASGVLILSDNVGRDIELQLFQIFQSEAVNLPMGCVLKSNRSGRRTTCEEKTKNYHQESQIASSLHRESFLNRHCYSFHPPSISILNLFEIIFINLYPRLNLPS